MSESSFGPGLKVAIHQLKAERHLALEEFDEALAELKTMESGFLSVVQRHSNTLARGRILETRGDRAGAIEAYREFLDPSHLVVAYSVWTAEISINYDLARLEEAEGDLVSARKHYRKYLDRWGEADVPLKNVADAKVRLAALQAKL